jgi:hypothetical protein
VETDVYRALRTRIGLFENIVGRLQPILAKLPKLITSRVLTGQVRTPEDRQAAVQDIEADADRVREGAGFDIDAVTAADLTEPRRPVPALTMDDLDRVAQQPLLLPPGLEMKPLDRRAYALMAPGLVRELRVSTDPAYYEANADTVELWSPGNPVFPVPETAASEPAAQRLSDLLAHADEE